MTDLRHVAEHEAAHTVMRYEYGRIVPGCLQRFRYVTIVQEGDAAGQLAGIESSWMDVEHREEMAFSPIEQQDAGTRRRVEHEIMVILAGTVWDEMHGRFDHSAVIQIDGHGIYVGRREHDLAIAYQMASLMKASDETIAAYHDWLSARARDFLSSPLVSPLVLGLAEALVDVETMRYAEAAHMIETHRDRMFAEWTARFPSDGDA